MNVIKYYATLLLLFVSLSIYDTTHALSSREFYSAGDMLREIELEEKLKENEEFISNLAKRESTDNPDTVNSIGAIGLFQFIPSTLIYLGYDISVKNFKENPSIFPANVQREALNKKIQLDINTLTKQWFRDSIANTNYIEKYVGFKVKGIEITLAGILAACHLSGAGGVIKYFDENKSPKDLYGTSLEDYLLEFSKYSYHNPTQIEKELLCIKRRKDGIMALTHSSKQLKLFYVMEELRGTEIPSTLNCQKQLGSLDRLITSTRLDLELKYSCQNTTEQSYTLEAAPQQNVGYPYRMGLEKLSGITVKSGTYWYNPILCMSRKLVIDSANSILSRSGMLHGTSKSRICLLNFGFRRLKNFPHLGVG